MMGCVFTGQKPSKLLIWYFFACKMSQRFAADQALQLSQLSQSVPLKSSDSKYSDSKSDYVNNLIADIQNDADSFDSDDEYANQEAPTNTDDCARARSSNDNDEQTFLRKYGSH